MKKTYLYMIGCAAALMMVGCAKDATVDNGGAVKAHSVSINAHVADEVSRLILDEEVDGVRWPIWEVGDQAALVDEMGAVRALTIDETITGPGQEGYTIFNGEAVVDFSKSAYPIVYPFDVVESVSGDVININLPDTQVGTSGVDWLMTGYTYTGDMSLGVDVTIVDLFNVVGFLELQVVGEGTVSKVTVQSASQKLSGAASLQMSYDGPAELTVTGANYVELVPAEAVALNASTPTSFFVALPAGTYPAGDLKVVFETSNGLVECESSAEHVLEVSHVKPLALSTASSSIEYIDLTAGDKYANSFIVSAEGWYKFDAKTKGGLTVIPHPKTGETMITIGSETAQACNAWESSEGMIQHVQYNAATNEISFYYNGVEGNSMITMVDNNLAVWNWHIWCTDVPAEQVIGNNTYMDRNLGAWNTPGTVEEAHDFLNRDDNLPGQGKSAVGLMWQWGRPIPFPGLGRYHLRGKDYQSWYQRETDGAVTFANLGVERGATISAAYGDQRAKCGSTGTFFFPSEDVMGSLYVGASAAEHYIDADGSEAYVEWTNRWNLVNNTNNVTMAVALSHPMQAYGTGAGNGADKANIKYWCNDLFSGSFDFASAHSPWNYGEGATVGKTFDVCPYGYHVPDGAEAIADYATLNFTWRNRYSNAETSADGYPTGTTRTAGAYATTNAGDFVWIPCSSARVYYGGAADCHNINWWCASNDNQEVAIQWAADANYSKTAVVQAGFYDKDGTNAGAINETAASLLLTTRCVKDK